MGRKVKYSAEEKINAVREYLDGNESMSSIAKHLNISFQSFKQWVKNYEAIGTDAFATNQNKHYSKVEKEQAVAAYLAGEGSLAQSCLSYAVRFLSCWVAFLPLSDRLFCCSTPFWSKQTSTHTLFYLSFWCILP